MKKIVITGGPCGGKTTVMAALRKLFAGAPVILLPEVATLLLEKGTYDLSRTTERVRFQEDIVAIQLRLEARYENADGVLVADRGLLDGSVYWPGGLEAWLDAFDLRFGECLGRYDAVVHLETLAALAGYRQTAVRREAPEEAVVLDRSLQAVWSRHPRWTRLGAAATVEDKVGQVAAEIRRGLASLPSPGLVAAARSRLAVFHLPSMVTGACPRPVGA